MNQSSKNFSLRNINNLLTLPKDCILAFKHEPSKQIWIGATVDASLYILNVLSNLRKNTKPYRQLGKVFSESEFIILEEISSCQKFGRTRLSYWMNYYANQGWYMYDRPIPNPMTLKVELASDWKVYVHACRTCKKRYVVGVFDKVPDALDFIEQAYGNAKFVHELVYAGNDLTKKYLRDHSPREELKDIKNVLKAQGLPVNDLDLISEVVDE